MSRTSRVSGSRRDMEPQYEPVFGRCHNCGQDTLRTWFPNVGGRLISTFACVECDAGICGSCRQHSAPGDRFCTNCRALLSLPRDWTVPDYPPS
jgi:hypothetical protein